MSVVTADRRRTRRRHLNRLLAGLETGILGGLAALVWLGVASLSASQSWWSFPNLLASGFYGEAAIGPGFGIPTMSGLALHFCGSGLAGVAFGLAAPEGLAPFRVAVLGLLWSLGCYYVTQLLVWKRFVPLALSYAPQAPILVGHVLYGACLSWYPNRLHSLNSLSYDDPLGKDTSGPDC